jgi:hypothetical protein
MTPYFIDLQSRGDDELAAHHHDLALTTHPIFYFENAGVKGAAEGNMREAEYNTIVGRC